MFPLKNIASWVRDIYHLQYHSKVKDTGMKKSNSINMMQIKKYLVKSLIKYSNYFKCFAYVIYTDITDINGYNHVFDLLKTIRVCKNANSKQHIELHH